MFSFTTLARNQVSFFLGGQTDVLWLTTKELLPISKSLSDDNGEDDCQRNWLMN